jgi:biopolymer transport protein ExbB/TolQ
MTGTFLPCAIECANRSMKRATIPVVRNLEHGLLGLSFIARTAPLLGALASATAALGPLMLQPTGLGDTAGGLAESLVPLILSLQVAVFAATLQFYFTGQVGAMQADTRAFTLALLNDLSHLQAGRGVSHNHPSLGGGNH